MEASQVIAEFFLNATVNRIFLIFGLALMLFSLADFNFVKMGKWARRFAFILSLIFVIGSLLGITDEQTKILSNAAKRDNTENKPPKDPTGDSPNNPVATKPAPVIPQPQPIEEKPKVTKTSGCSLENITYSGRAGNLDGRITFYNQSGNVVEFTGTLSIRNISGFARLDGNKLTITRSDNAQGYFTFLQGCGKLVGTPVSTEPFNESISVELYRE